MKISNDLLKGALLQYNKYSELDFIVKPSLPILYFGDLNAYLNSNFKVITAALNPSDAGWCVFNISSEPTNFTTSTSALTTANKPLWGYCPATFSLDVTASNSSDYTLSGTDRNGNISGSDPNLTFSVGDTINFVVNASGHPFYLKQLQELEQGVL